MTTKMTGFDCKSENIFRLMLRSTMTVGDGEDAKVLKREENRGSFCCSDWKNTFGGQMGGFAGWQQRSVGCSIRGNY